MCVKIKDSWKQFFYEQKQQKYFQQLLKTIKEEYLSGVCYPPKPEIFAIFKLVELNDLKVVIIGQDPYHNQNQANGIAFSVTNQVPTPPSLLNIFKELQLDLNINHFNNNDLSGWVKQGVFLMNTIWTVRAHQPASHSQLGWKQFTINLLNLLNQNKGLIYVLWGNYAKSFIPYLTNSNNVILTSAHPSPFSYSRFVGTRPFSIVNNYLIQQNQSPIDWAR